MVFLKEKLGFQGSGEAPERGKARPFPGGAPGAPSGGLLQDFGDFWLPPGVQKGARFHLKGSFFQGFKTNEKTREFRVGGGGPGGMGAQPLAAR